MPRYECTQCGYAFAVHDEADKCPICSGAIESRPRYECLQCRTIFDGDDETDESPCCRAMVSSLDGPPRLLGDLFGDTSHLGSYHKRLLEAGYVVSSEDIASNRNYVGLAKETLVHVHELLHLHRDKFDEQELATIEEARRIIDRVT